MLNFEADCERREARGKISEPDCHLRTSKRHQAWDSSGAVPQWNEARRGEARYSVLRQVVAMKGVG